MQMWSNKQPYCTNQNIEQQNDRVLNVHCAANTVFFGLMRRMDLYTELPSSFFYLVSDGQYSKHVEDPAWRIYVVHSCSVI